ncbi:hypothetical protein [Tsuneonella rigui]|uniref:hypothetical protein n=1 Tax=Tsuneonella rigui TaxID=1708790 RepID=UPI000F7F1CF7|nr:hypothetical protein [Tsuneonella rigui]
MGEEAKRPNPIEQAARADLLGRAKAQLEKLFEHWVRNSAVDHPPPIVPRDESLPGRDWLPEPNWISGWLAFELLRLQCEPYEWAPPLARICQIIADQWDRDETGLNYAMASLPPSHELLARLTPGSTHWFRAAYDLLTLKGADGIEGWETFVSDLYDWVGPYDCLRLRAADLVDHALAHHWSVREISLPEAKQEPIWSFPKAMTWIATRDYMALARLPHFCRPDDEDSAAAAEGVWHYATRFLGWLHAEISYLHCKCGAIDEFGFESYKHCTCTSLAWEELVLHRGGLAPDIPELVFNLQEGWLSMTWPDGADEIRFMRREILDKWPAPIASQAKQATVEVSTAAGEQACREWLIKEFAADPDKRRTKRSFREAAIKAFPGRVSERGFNLRVWPELARQHARDSAGAKRKS